MADKNKKKAGDIFDVLIQDTLESLPKIKIGGETFLIDEFKFSPEKMHYAGGISKRLTEKLKGPNKSVDVIEMQGAFRVYSGSTILTLDGKKWLENEHDFSNWVKICQRFPEIEKEVSEKSKLSEWVESMKKIAAENNESTDKEEGDPRKN